MCVVMAMSWVLGASMCRSFWILACLLGLALAKIDGAEVDKSGSSIEKTRTSTKSGTNPNGSCGTPYMLDPRIVYETVTTTLYTTRLSTLKRLFRTTSYSTTTATSTIRLTKTVLSISARTVTSSIIFTQPVFEQVTKYGYVDRTEITTVDGQTVVATVTETEIVSRNVQSRTTTTITSLDSTFIALTTESIVIPTASVYVFTDVTNSVSTFAPFTSTDFLLLSATNTVTVTRFPTPFAFTETTNLIVFRARRSGLLSTTFFTQAFATVFVSLSDPVAQVTFVPTATFTLPID